jgi:hypothetical protein
MKPLAKRAFKGRRSERAASCGDRLRAERAISGRGLGRYETQPGHQLARRFEPAEITGFGKDRRRGDEIEAAHRHHRGDRWRQRPIGEGLLDRPLEPNDARPRLACRLQQLIEDNALLEMGESLARQPLPMLAAPPVC